MEAKEDLVKYWSVDEKRQWNAVLNIVGIGFVSHFAPKLQDNLVLFFKFDSQAVQPLLNACSLLINFFVFVSILFVGAYGHKRAKKGYAELERKPVIFFVGAIIASIELTVELVKVGMPTLF